MAAAAVGGAVETVGLAADQRAYAMPGQLYDVGGYRLHLDCAGSGGPAVVLTQRARRVLRQLGPHRPDRRREPPRVVPYDRAGQGWSEDAPSRQDGGSRPTCTPC